MSCVAYLKIFADYVIAPQEEELDILIQLKPKWGIEAQ